MLTEYDRVNKRQGNASAGDLLLNTIIEHFVLLRAHLEYPIKGKAILLWSRNGLRIAHHDCLKIVTE